MPGHCVRIDIAPQVHEPGIYLLDDRQLRKVVDHHEREMLTHEAAEVRRGTGLNAYCSCLRKYTRIRDIAII